MSYSVALVQDDDRRGNESLTPANRAEQHQRRTHTFEMCALVAVLVFIVLFWRLGEPTLWDPDEAHYAETSREMARTGDWLVPRYNNEPFFDKPALFHVLQALTMRVLGPTELAARAVPALAALALIATTAWFGAAIGSGEVGLVAACLLAGSPGIFGLARYAILDTLFTAFEFGGVAMLAVAALRARPRLQYGGYVLLALAVLTKGPLAFALCGLTFVVALTVSADARRRLLQLHWVAGLGIVLALSAPWFVYMYWRFGRAFVDGYLFNENLLLYATPRFANQPPLWFYFQVLAAGLLPWTGLLIGRLVDDARALWGGECLDTLDILLWAWTAAIVGFFTFSNFRLDHYVFPAAPALCFLAARTWHDVRHDHATSRHAASRIGMHLVGPMLVAVGLGAGVFMIARLELPRAAALVPIALVVAGASLTALVNVRGIRPPRVPWLVMSAMAVTYAGLIVFVMPRLEEHKVVPGLARWVATHAAPTDRIGVYRLNRWTAVFRFYLDRQTTHLDSVDEARAFFAAPQPFYCAMLERTYQEFAAQGVPLRVVNSREGMWATSGSVLWRRRIPPARFVIVTRAQ